jgi:predicted dienelactone hydrolase
MRFLFALASLLAVMWPGLSGAEQTTVGTKRLFFEVAGTEIMIRTFYPTEASAELRSFGPWELEFASSAIPKPGTYPLVILSHGLGGNDWNHHLLASELVQAGFVVGALRHPDDWLRLGSEEHFYLRPEEVRAAVSFLGKGEFLGQHIDSSRLGAFGFSLGGFSVLAAAGGEFDPRNIARHCKSAAHDPAFCGSGTGDTNLPPGLRLRRMFYAPPKIEDRHSPGMDKLFRAIVLAAPVGVPFTRLDEVEAATMLIRAEDDRILEYPYHAEHIHQLLQTPHRYSVAENTHHYAFLSPFPASIADEVGEPAEDPPGFDRAGFLRDTNSGIVEFFIEALISGET